MKGSSLDYDLSILTIENPTNKSDNKWTLLRRMSADTLDCTYDNVLNHVAEKTHMYMDQARATVCSKNQEQKKLF